VEELYEFGPYRLDAAKRLLTRDGESVTLAPKTYELLLLLVQSGGKALSKQELMSALWQDTFVEEANLSFQITNLRKALGEEWVETVPRHGYRFTAAVRTVTTEVAGSDGRIRRIVPWLIAGVASAIALVVLVFYPRERPSAQPPVRSSIALPSPATVSDLSLSPDGRYLAISAVVGGKGALWIRPLDGSEARPLSGTEDGRFPFWSPDSRFIGFFAQGKLKKIALAGGPAQTLCDAPSGRGGTWNREGVIVFAPNPADRLYRVAATGGFPSPITSAYARYPAFLPDGRHFLYAFMGEKAGTFLGSLESKDSNLVIADVSNLAYAPSGRAGAGYVLFVRGRTLMAQPLDTKHFRVQGEAVPLADGIKRGAVTLNFPFSMSGNGVLTWLDAGTSDDSQLLWFDRQGTQFGAVGEPGIQSTLSLDRTSNRVAISRFKEGMDSIWLLNTAGGAASRFTLYSSGSSGSPLWSPDGSHIAFVKDTGGGGIPFTWHTAIYQKDVSGTGAEELLLKAPFAELEDWSPDGRMITYSAGETGGQNTRYDTWLLPLDGDRKPVLFIQGPASEWNGKFSPDGRWLAYVSDETGRQEVYVQRLPDPVTAAGVAADRRGKRQLTTNGGSQPCWRADGKELFYVTPGGMLMSIAVKTGVTFEASQPRPLFQTRALQVASQRHYEVTPDGQRFLINTQVGELPQAPITVLVNWEAALNR